MGQVEADGHKKAACRLQVSSCWVRWIWLSAIVVVALPFLSFRTNTRNLHSDIISNHDSVPSIAQKERLVLKDISKLTEERATEQKMVQRRLLKQRQQRDPEKEADQRSINQHQDTSPADARASSETGSPATKNGNSLRATAVTTAKQLQPSVTTSMELNAASVVNDTTFRVENTMSEAPLTFDDNFSPQETILALAPWDPVFGLGGADQISQPCQAEIDHYCQDPIRLPWLNCLSEALKEHTKGSVDHTFLFSKTCRAAMDPCTIGGSGSEKNCELARAYRNTNSLEDIHILEQILKDLHKAAREAKAVYWMTAGSMIGSVYHHGRIPWDDDVDVYVLRQHMEPLLTAIQKSDTKTTEFACKGGLVWKVFRNDTAKAGKSQWGWPFVDVFPVDCPDSDPEWCFEAAVQGHRDRIPFRKANVFPLKQRPFGRLTLPFPKHAQQVVEDRYSPRVGERCVVGSFIHSKESFDRSHRKVYNCTDLPLYPHLVQNSTGQRAMQHVPETPWLDQKEFTVEHLMDGKDQILSSIVYDQGNEVYRSYVDGLIGVDVAAISFTPPQLLLVENPRTTPLLASTRRSYLRNFANRSAEALNLELMPLLNRVEVGNDYANLHPAPNNGTLDVVVWNAERGTHWDALSDFMANPDIVILNEMDWGMARSGNAHTTHLLATHLKMNYAFGVEFLELTNGNAKEINATQGQSNTVGYHGNVVLSKWPIVPETTKVIRLHELYDHLYKAKVTGADRGERRLGGRMALFAVSQLPDGRQLLLVVAHGHGGAKPNKLTADAKLICHEIQSYFSRLPISAVFVGGDMARHLAKHLQGECSDLLLPLPQTNNFRNNGKGGAVPTWRVECKNGGPPQARFERGDWLLAGGPAFAVRNNTDAVQTIHPYRKLSDDKYLCISDHSMLLLKGTLALAPPVAEQ